jgi:hypothetical protein
MPNRSPIVTGSRGSPEHNEAMNRAAVQKWVADYERL